MNFEFYVLNYDFNRKKVINFNIFQNTIVNNQTQEEIKKYLSSPDGDTYIYEDVNGKRHEGFDGLCESIRCVLQYQEWSRREYEISVGDAFETKIKNFEKWDCYSQALPNIRAIVRECIYQYIDNEKRIRSNCELANG